MKIPVPLLPRWLRWLVVAVVVGFIFYASIVTVPPETAVDAGKPDLVPLDKWRHFLAYAALGFAPPYATIDWESDLRLLAAVVVGTTILYGVGIEVGQSLIPARYFSVGDASANAIGGALVAPFYLLRPYVDFLPIWRWTHIISRFG